MEIENFYNQNVFRFLDYKNQSKEEIQRCFFKIKKIMLVYTFPTLTDVNFFDVLNYCTQSPGESPSVDLQVASLDF